MEGQATNSPVKLRIASLCSCEHNIEYKERKKDAKHTNKLEYGSSSNVAVLLLLDRLDQACKHNTKAKEIADVSKVHIEIPAEHLDVIKDAETRNASYKSEGAINGLIDQLCCSVFNHNTSVMRKRIFFCISALIFVFYFLFS